MRAERFHYFLVMKNRFSDNVASWAVDEATDQALRAIETGKAFEIKKRQAWMWRTAFNAACRFANQEARYEPLEEARLKLPRCDEQDSEIDLHVTEMVQMTLSGLSERQRKAVTLWAQGELGYAAIAEELGITPGSLRRHLHSAKKALREILGAHLPSRRRKAD
jgi:RNA polymerase sigma-70 factor (ECF subfamily)